MSISRRNALVGATAAVAVATVPHAVAARAALGGDPVMPAYEAFEAARLKYTAACDHVCAVGKEVEAGLPPHRNRPKREMSFAEWEEDGEWNKLRNRRVAVQLGADEDDFCNAYLGRMECAYADLAAIQPTTIEGARCKILAWWQNYEDPDATDVPTTEPGTAPAEAVLRSLYHDLERLAGEARP